MTPTETVFSGSTTRSRWTYGARILCVLLMSLLLASCAGSPTATPTPEPTATSEPTPEATLEATEEATEEATPEATEEATEEDVEDAPDFPVPDVGGDETEEATAEAAQADEDEAAVETPEALRVGIVTFLSGQGAPFGVPSRNAAETIFEELNNGNAPAPYDQIGFGGVPIEAVYVDEAGSTSEQVTQFRRLVEDENVDMVLGYVSSANCQAIAPVADELEMLTVFYTCASRRLFEDDSYEYVFRTKGIDLVYNVSAARYLLRQNPEIQTIAGINPDYSWGRDSWSAFSETILQLQPDVEIATEQFPQLFASDYSSEISTLLNQQPDALHSSFWGSDLETFVSQAGARGVFDQSRGVFIIGEAMLPTLGDAVPQGLIIGAEGRHGRLAPDNELNDWFRSSYEADHDERPIHTAYHMALTILGVKAAYEQALTDTDNEWVSDEQVRDAFRGLSFDTPSGEIRMTLADGHQAVEPMAFAISGEFDDELGEVTLVDEVVYPIECVNPPEGTTGLDWIQEGFPGAECPAAEADGDDAPEAATEETTDG